MRKAGERKQSSTTGEFTMTLQLLRKARKTSLVNFKRSKFFGAKSDMPKDMCEFMHQEKTRGHPISIIRQDNAGENKKLVTLAHSKEWKLETNFENTARKTPQHAELAFTVIAAKTRAVMNAAQIPKSECFKMWSEAATTVTALDNLIPVTFN
jgi:hypothetical protein